MNMNQEPEWQQSHFHDWHLRRERFWESLNEQSHQLRQIETALLQEDPFEINSKVVELDFEVLRFACYSLQTRIEEVALHDGARLIAKTVLDFSDGKVSGPLWENWLSAAPCWSVLAQDQWKYAKVKAYDLVVDELESVGVFVNASAKKEIGRAISNLKLQDLLPSGLFARVYPEDDPADNGEEES